ncbi:MAG: pyridine nucleotide-disulfide oxidoreductase [Polaromonas sp.]|nr:pyridine nucleotide-disulfide oxidoreductase [Polaromonas sp.]
MKRRHFLNATAAGVTASVLAACGGGGDSTDAQQALGFEQAQDAKKRPTPVLGGSAKSQVIVVGGGMAGASVAKYLSLWGDGVQVTLVERATSYTSNIMSSMVLTGQRNMGSLAYNHSTLASKYGVKVVLGDVVNIDPVGVKVTLSTGTVLSADRIVLAPGIDFDEVPGLGTSNKMPHAWQAGPQTSLLASQLAAMPSNGTVILTIPKVPYRCPPGPYERACLVADWIKARRPRGKLVVLDANLDFVTEKDNFSNAFFGLHGGVIEYVTNATVTQVDPASMQVYTTQGVYRGDVVNLIPRQKAGRLVVDAGLANATEGRFAGVNVLSYASTVAGAEKVHIIGDSSATTQPKAGHIANQEGKVCADAISRLLVGQQPDPEPVTNSACFSTITMTQASWLTAAFQYDPATLAMKVVPASSAASTGWNKDNFEDMSTWFKALMADTFA